MVSSVSDACPSQFIVPTSGRVRVTGRLPPASLTEALWLLVSIVKCGSSFVVAGSKRERFRSALSLENYGKSLEKHDGNVRPPINSWPDRLTTTN
nr:unnamed protein product [Spirometra erinaceieuropaei]